MKDSQKWQFKSLGDGMWVDISADEVKQTFQPFFESAGRPAEMAVFTQHKLTNLHCEWIAFFSPAAVEVGKAVGASSCVKPARQGLTLLAGSDESWFVLF